MTLIRADARTLPLADASVDLVVTSPPYWSLRSYTDGGEHYAGQIGAEPTPTAYVDSLIDVTRECMRVLRPSGSIWVNLGDKYAADLRGPNGESSGLTNGAQHRPGERSGVAGRRPRGSAAAGVPRKSLIGLPWRYALRCIDELGLILRAEVIWAKPNGLPESATDRVRRSHEQWFHMVKSPRYFSAVDAIREPVSDYARPRNAERGIRGSTTKARAMTDTCNPLGALPSSVWSVATEPLTVPDHLGVDHYAAFPMEWPRRIIRGWSPSGICTACGEGRRPVADRERIPGWTRQTPAGRQRGITKARGEGVGQVVTVGSRVTITGEACACPDTSAPTRPAVVLDVFGGTGTTALVAEALGRRGVSVDMSADYLRIARWRTTDPGQRAKSLGVPKPRPEADGQLDLLAGVIG